jgi:prepilin-type processing-associated H-X9-DG protein
MRTASFFFFCIGHNGRPDHGNRPSSAAPRHGDTTQRLPGAINVALFDGHVEKAPLENLWNYYWNATWQIPSPRPR